MPALTHVAQLVDRRLERFPGDVALGQAPHHRARDVRQVPITSSSSFDMGREIVGTHATVQRPDRVPTMRTWHRPSLPRRACRGTLWRHPADLTPRRGERSTIARARRAPWPASGRVINAMRAAEGRAMPCGIGRYSTPVFAPSRASLQSRAPCPKLDELVIGTLPHVPRAMMWRPGQALRRRGKRSSRRSTSCAELGERGHPGIIDVLGEDVTGEAHARRVVDEYLHAADAVVAARLDATCRSNRTHVGLRTSEEASARSCTACSRGTASSAACSCASRWRTHDDRRDAARVRAVAGEFDNVGVVLQARLLRTPGDIAKLAPGPLARAHGQGHLPRTRRDRAHAAGADPRCVRRVHAAPIGAQRVRPFATHDGDMADKLIELTRQHGLAAHAVRVPSAARVQEGLWERWSKPGTPCAVYVPFGPSGCPTLETAAQDPECCAHLMRATLGLGKQ